MTISNKYVICIKADLDIDLGGTEFNVDPLLATSLYNNSLMFRTHNMIQLFL